MVQRSAQLLQGSCQLFFGVACRYVCNRPSTLWAQRFFAMQPLDLDSMLQLAAESNALREDIRETGQWAIKSSASLRSLYCQVQAEVQAELVHEQAAAASSVPQANTRCQAPQPKAPAQVLSCFASCLLVGNCSAPCLALARCVRATVDPFHLTELLCSLAAGNTPCRGWPTAPSYHQPARGKALYS